MLDGTGIPAWATDTLDKVSQIAPSAHIAGGFLRDLDNGVAPKDLDIFVPSGCDIVAIEKVLKDTHGGLGEKHLDDPTYNAHTGLIASSREYIDESGALIPVNVIEIPGLKDDPFDNCSRFDFGICQITYDRKRGVIKTGWYDRDQKRKDFTLVNCLNTSQYVRAQFRFNRIKPRYKGWSMYVPYKFREYGDDFGMDVF